MRSNITASMLDLSMKDKSRNPLGKLKNKLKGKRGSAVSDTVSAIIPSISHSPADSDEEPTEKEKKKSKFKTLFSKPGLHKSNISQSMSVLPTLQPVTEKVRLRPSDFSSQWGDDDDDDDDTLTPVSEKPSANRADSNLLFPSSSTSHKRTGSSDSKQLGQIASSSKKDTLSLFGGLKPKNDPASRSNVCINGSHIYVEHSDVLPKDGTPSSPSPLTSRQKRLFLSQENLSSETSKEPGELPTGKGSPESSSLESFKAMTLPSYKLLSGDFLESSTPMNLDILKETKENKKQENKKSGILSLVTGKKEARSSEETESGAVTPPKLKEAKREEKESARKETNPFEIPGEGKRNRGPDHAVDTPIEKASSNRFDDIIAEEKSGKSTAPVKPSQTKPIKPRLHPVKPMNATTNKQSTQTFNVAKILDNQSEPNLKKYNPSDPAYAYAQLTHDELIQLVLKQKDVIAKRDLQVRELEDYIDDLLVRVMEETPNILRVQNRATKKAGKM